VAFLVLGLVHRPNLQSTLKVDKLYPEGFFKNSHVVVLGLARSGESAARLLCELGASVLISDQKNEEQLVNIVSVLRSEYPQIRFHLGGHPEEIFRSADLVVLSPGVPANMPVLEIARKRGVPVIGEVELAYNVCRSPVIAITGTKGKSTTSTLAGQILSKGFKKGNVIVAGNIGTPLSKYVLGLSESDLLVLEISSFQLETTLNFRPKVSVILNIMQDHIDRHSDLKEYITAKHRIFANQTQDDYTILNADDERSYACASLTRAKVIFYSSTKKLDSGVYMENGKITAHLNDANTISICGDDELRISGRHNLENALAATAIGLLYGVTSDDIRNVLNSFTGLEHALEFVSEVNGVRFINDSKATNVISLKAALESMDGRIILIIGGRDKGNDYTSVISLIKDKVPDMIIIGESAEKIQDSLGSFTRSHKAATMKDAIYKAFEVAHPGDSVLLSPACASFDMFTDYAERGRIFKETVQTFFSKESLIKEN